MNCCFKSQASVTASTEVFYFTTGSHAEHEVRWRLYGKHKNGHLPLTTYFLSLSKNATNLEATQEKQLFFRSHPIHIPNLAFSLHLFPPTILKLAQVPILKLQ